MPQGGELKPEGSPLQRVDETTALSPGEGDARLLRAVLHLHQLTDQVVVAVARWAALEALASHRAGQAHVRDVSAADGARPMPPAGT